MLNDAKIEVPVCPSESLETDAGVRLRDGYMTGSERRGEILLGGTGPFRGLLEEYIGSVAPRIYRPGYCVQVRCSLAGFLRFVNQELGFEDLELIRPSTIASYIQWLRGHGYHSSNFLGHLSSFFGWLASIGKYDRGNPVIHRFHREMMTAPNSPEAPSGYDEKPVTEATLRHGDRED
jgi:hypothetical protein